LLPAEFVKAVEDQAVPLDAELREALEALPRHGRKVFRFVDGRAPQSGRLITEDGVGHRIVKLAKRAGVKLSLHSLRKGFGRYYASRVPARVLQKLMRHAAIKITMDYYANVDAATEEAVRARRCNSSRNTHPARTSQAETDP
jgi:integrase